MDYETALALKSQIVGRTEHIDGILLEAAEKLQVEGEIDLGLDGPDYGQAQIWVDCNPS